MLFANLSFASDRFLLSEEFFSSSGSRNSRQLLTDKFNLNLQYCMLGISKSYDGYLKFLTWAFSPDP